MTTSPPPAPAPATGTARVQIAVPSSWSAERDPGNGLLVAARSREAPASGFRPELSLRCSPVDGTLEEWRAAATVELGRRLEDLEVEDEDVYDLDGTPVSYARCGHRAGARDLVSEQWAWLVDGVGVKGTILEHGRGPKIIVFKMKRRKQYKRKQGHRQDYTAVRIDSIG